MIECIRSIRSLDTQPKNIIVVDNYSNDESVRVLSKQKEEFNFHLLVASENK